MPMAYKQLRLIVRPNLARHCVLVGSNRHAPVTRTTPPGQVGGQLGAAGFALAAA